jgi:hypothetical protein
MHTHHIVSRKKCSYCSYGYIGDWWAICLPTQLLHALIFRHIFFVAGTHTLMLCLPGKFIRTSNSRPSNWNCTKKIANAALKSWRSSLLGNKNLVNIRRRKQKRRPSRLIEATNWNQKLFLNFIVNKFAMFVVLRLIYSWSFQFCHNVNLQFLYEMLHTMVMRTHI